jgi:fucose 4-O-acetylase-like acetyltransferase
MAADHGRPDEMSPDPAAPDLKTLEMPAYEAPCKDSPSDSVPSSPSRPRDVRLDVIKGVAILAVITLHVTGNRARQVSTEGSSFWYGLKIANLAMNFAVPAFLVISAFLWTQSYIRRGNLLEFMGTRIVGVAVPYAIWSAFYELFNGYVIRRTGLPDTIRIISDFEFGKANYHLYFMFLLIQLVVFTPVVALLFKWIRMPFWIALLFSAALQAGVFHLQKTVWHLPSPGSFAGWTILGWLPAVWLATNGRTLKPSIPWALALAVGTIGGGYFFFINSVSLLSGGPASNIELLWSTIFFAYGTAWTIIALVMSMPIWNWLQTGLNWMGQKSLQLYLIHPAVLAVLASPRMASYLPSGYANPVAVWSLTLLITSAITVSLTFLRLDGILFWQWPPKPRVLPRSADVSPAQP